MIGLIIQLLILGILLGLVVWLAGQIPFMAPFARIIGVVASVLFVIYVLYVLMGFFGGGRIPVFPQR